MCPGKAVRVELSSRVVPVKCGLSGRTSITPSPLENSTHTPTQVRQKSSRTCCPYLEIQPREQPTTILRTLLTLGCFRPFLSNGHISPFLSELK
ncbi:unnamed protein product [Tetraodon nigroviridis]|uniref:(spotted green pufferfish) hypothetical protein n=1 Tax=Tetraodon nigroviridis TaxID=99883 RepID=Q4T765_TETNG|nr:unnamed protein product [Tetraodon nigroviridis]